MNLASPGGPRNKAAEKGWGGKDPGKDGDSLTCMSLGKLPPLGFTFPKVCPSGLGQLFTGAASAVPRGPGQPDSSHPPIHTHTHTHATEGAGLQGTDGGSVALLCGWHGLAELDVQARDGEAWSQLPPWPPRKGLCGGPAGAGVACQALPALSPSGCSETCCVLGTVLGSRGWRQPWLTWW